MEIAREPAIETPAIPSAEARVRPVIRRAFTPVRLALLPFPRRDWHPPISDAPGAHTLARLSSRLGFCY